MFNRDHKPANNNNDNNTIIERKEGRTGRMSVVESEQGGMYLRAVSKEQRCQCCTAIDEHLVPISGNNISLSRITRSRCLFGVQQKQHRQDSTEG